MISGVCGFTGHLVIVWLLPLSCGDFFASFLHRVFLFDFSFLFLSEKLPLWESVQLSTSCTFADAECGPCLRIAPAFNALSNKYPQATFLEVDVHQCQGTAATNNISATPTFLFFRNKVRIDQYQGADAVGLEDKIKQHLENDPGNSEDTDIPKGYMDLLPFINKAGCECLNESDEHGFENCLRKDSSYLESDCDEQLLITVAFSQPVKLYSMKLQGPDNGQGPKYIKMFINLPRSMDFEEAERSEPTQALELGPEDIREDGIIQLRYVKFQNVNSVTLFVQSNHGDEETTRITYFTFIGTPVQATNMNDFKRIIHMGHLSLSASDW
ncbi:thioredoxin-like protein 1 isoform 1-T1 [Acridotheres tristis]